MNPTSYRSRDLIWVALVLAPIAIFYTVLLWTGFNLPREDDYDAILRFMTGFEAQTGLLAKIKFYLASQHNDYKLYYTHGVVIVQHSLVHHINFLVLQQIGNLAMLGTFLVLACNLPKHSGTLKEKALLLLPASLLLFSFRTHITLNWAMASLQNVSVVFFALVSLHFLVRKGVRSFFLACVFLVVAVATSANGFVLLLTGSWLLLENLRWKALVAWWGTGALLVAAYAYHYTRYRPTTVPISAAHSAAAWAVFPFAFLGNSMPKLVGALPLGLFLCAALILAVQRGLRNRSPFLFHASIFVITTAVGVSVPRHAGGFGAALTSRYGVYGLLFASVVFLSIVATRQVASSDRKVSPWSDGLALAVGFSFALWLLYIPVGVGPLRREKKGIEAQAASWERGVARTPVFYLDIPNPGERESSEQRAPQILLDSRRMGIYQMPSF